MLNVVPLARGLIALCCVISEKKDKIISDKDVEVLVENMQGSEGISFCEHEHQSSNCWTRKELKYSVKQECVCPEPVWCQCSLLEVTAAVLYKKKFFFNIFVGNVIVRGFSCLAANGCFGLL